MGLGLQLVDWPASLVQGLQESGYRVLRYDNRDSGLSTALDHLGKPKVAWSMLRFQMGLELHPPYTLSDMTADAFGLLDALGIARAHVIGLSMGGMVAQRMAIAVPQRVLSLTSLMSSSGAKGLPGPLPHVLKAMMQRPAGQDEASVVRQTLQLLQAVGSPAYPIPPEQLRQQIAQGYRRSYRPVGTKRQMLAVMADRARAALLGRITSPTLVLHGRADPLVPFACAEDTARRIPGAKLLGIDGLGHDLPEQGVEHILAALLPHLLAAQLRTATSA
jgi:pimeloyl-ACP methyl ester carboxylesterase